MNTIVRDYLGEAITGIFRFMEIAEEEIAAAQRRWPRHADALWDSFRLLTPTKGFRHKSEHLYRQHCREILERVTEGEDTRPGTKAEVLIGLVEVSLAVPLKPEAQYLYTRLFLDLHNPSAPQDVLQPAQEMAEHLAALGYDREYPVYLVQARKKATDSTRTPDKWRDGKEDGS